MDNGGNARSEIPGSASIHSITGSLRKKVIWRLAYRRVSSFIFSAMAASPAPEDMAGASAIPEAESSATKNSR